MRINERSPLRPRYEVRDVIVSIPAPQSDATLDVLGDGSVVHFGSLSAGIRVR